MSGEIVRTYDYHGPNGKGLLYQKVRLEPKSFRHRRPTPDGGWSWKLGDVQRVLYRLPQLLASEEDEAVVYYVEGEKDADRLAEAGLVATTAGGVSDWRPEMAESLAGRDVVILPDNDQPGRKHAAQVARAIQPKALRVRMVDLPGLREKGDVSDWLDDGHTVEELLDRVSRVGEWVDGGDEPAFTMRRGIELVDLILERSALPWVTLSLGGEIATVRSGGIVVIMGPSGSGKSSFTAALIIEHAREHGPAIYLSRELPAEEIAARMVGMQTDSSWEAVLRGRVPREFMAQKLDLPRLIVIDRKDANLDILARALRATRRDYPEGPILVAVDYTQIIPSKGDDARAKVADAMERTDELAREFGAVVLVISQMSRSNARLARTGESLGAETTDGGAESAAIERYASLTLTLGGFSTPQDDGSQTAQLSLGKYRMGRGDQVRPMKYEGRTGRWRVDGEAKAAAEMRAAAAAKIDDEKVGAAVRAMRDAVSKAKEPVTRDELRRAAATSRTRAEAALSRLLSNGEIVEVQRRRARSSAWLLWTKELAEKEGVPCVSK